MCKRYELLCRKAGFRSPQTSDQSAQGAPVSAQPARGSVPAAVPADEAGDNGDVQRRGPVHRFTRAEWQAFTAGVRAGEFDLDESGRLP